MSDKDLDKLFKGKLEEYAPTPSPGAWERLSEELQPAGHRSGSGWWRAAAAVLLLLGAGAVVFFSIPEQGTTPTADTQVIDKPATLPAQENGKLADAGNAPGETPPPEPADDSEQEEMPETPAEILPSEQQKTDLPPPSQQDTPAPATPGKDERNVPDDPSALAAEPLIAAAQEPKQEDLPEVQEVVIDKPATTVAGTTVSFRIEEFASAEIAEEPDTASENSNGFKKMWSILKQVKEPDAGLGNLREMKNDLLAFRKAKKDEDKQ